VAATRFVILCLGRTGSTHLQSMLDFHSQARCHGELFGEGKPPTFASSRHSDPADFLDEMLAEGDGEERAIGFKLPMNSIRLEPATADLVRAEPRMSVVRLSRRNRLAQLVSRRMMAATGVSQSIFGDYGDATVRIDPAECLAALAAMESEEAELDALGAGAPTFRIDYEQLADPPALEALQGFLGLDPEPLRSWFTKVRTRPLAETVSNWDELERALRGGRFEPLLSAPD
jgi:hypothetical protein